MNEAEKRWVEQRRGGWFVFGDDIRGASGPWRNRAAAEAAMRQDYTEAHRLERPSNGR